MNNLAYTHNHQSLDVLKKQLANHPLYSAIEHKHQIIYFMEQHVFAVWDFMSLIKSAQNQIAPTTTPWTPSANPEHVNFINQLGDSIKESADDDEMEFSSLMIFQQAIEIFSLE